MLEGHSASVDAQDAKRCWEVDSILDTMPKTGVPVVDFHCDTLSEILHKGGNLAKRDVGHLDAERLSKAGVSLQVFAIFSNPQTKRGSLQDAITMIELFWQAVDEQCITPILWRDDLQKSTITPKGMLSLEGGEPLNTDPRLLQFFFRLGVRAVGLTWNGRNSLADGVGESISGGGLTSFGRAMITEMNRLGILVDVSHISEAGFWNIVDLCQGPFIASHSNCRALCDHPRNLTDDQLRAIAACGGVVGLNFLPHFLHSSGHASSADIIRHAEHMLTVMGRGHIGLGSDYDGIAVTPDDLPDVTAMPRLYEALSNHFGESVAREIMGGSFTDLLSQCLPTKPSTGLHEI